jgi:hypothetical protein
VLLRKVAKAKNVAETVENPWENEDTASPVFPFSALLFLHNLAESWPNDVKKSPS